MAKVREGGGVITARIVMAAARGIILSYDKFKLAEFGGHVELNHQGISSPMNQSSLQVVFLIYFLNSIYMCTHCAWFIYSMKEQVTALFRVTYISKLRTGHFPRGT